MIRRGPVRDDRYLIAKSLQRAESRLASDGALVLRETVAAAPAAFARYTVHDAGEPAPTPAFSLVTRARAESVTVRSLKRILGVNPFGSAGFVGGIPVEFFSTSPWHALFARRLLHAEAPAHLPYPDHPVVRIYHDPFTPAALSPDAEARPLALYDFRETRALLLGSLPAGEIAHALALFVSALLPRRGELPLRGVARAVPGERRPTLLLGPAALPSHKLTAADSYLWSEGACLRLAADLFGPNAGTDEGRLLPAPAADSRPALSPPAGPRRLVFSVDDPHSRLPLLARVAPAAAADLFEVGYGTLPIGARAFVRTATDLGRLGLRFLGAPSSPQAWLLNVGRLEAGAIPTEVATAVLRALESGTLDGAPLGPASPAGLSAVRAIPDVDARWLTPPPSSAEMRLRALLR